MVFSSDASSVLAAKFACFFSSAAAVFSSSASSALRAPLLFLSSAVVTKLFCRLLNASICAKTDFNSAFISVLTTFASVVVVAAFAAFAARSASTVAFTPSTARTLAFSLSNLLTASSSAVNRLVVGPSFTLVALNRTLANRIAVSRTCQLCAHTAMSAVTTTHSVLTISGTVLRTRIIPARTSRSPRATPHASSHASSSSSSSSSSERSSFSFKSSSRASAPRVSRASPRARVALFARVSALVAGARVLVGARAGIARGVVTPRASVGRSVDRTMRPSGVARGDGDGDGDGEVALRVVDARDVARGARAREDARASRTLKLRLATGDGEVVVVERERWTGVATIEDVERGATVAVARAALARTTSGVALANAGEVRAAARGGGDAVGTRERAARDARVDLDARSTSDVAARAPKFVEFDPSEAVTVRVGAAATPASEVARRLAATTLRAAPAAAAPRGTRDGDGDGARANDDPPAPPIVRKKPALPPGRRAVADA